MLDKNGIKLQRVTVWIQQKTSICLHRELVEQFHHIMLEPVVDGEDPKSFLISENHGHLYFSVASKSDSRAVNPKNKPL